MEELFSQGAGKQDDNEGVETTAAVGGGGVVKGVEPGGGVVKVVDPGVGVVKVVDPGVGVVKVVDAGGGVVKGVEPGGGVGKFVEPVVLGVSEVSPSETLGAGSRVFTFCNEEATEMYDSTGE